MFNRCRSSMPTVSTMNVAQKFRSKMRLGMVGKVALVDVNQR